DELTAKWDTLQIELGTKAVPAMVKATEAAIALAEATSLIGEKESSVFDFITSFPGKIEDGMQRAMKAAAQGGEALQAMITPIARVGQAWEHQTEQSKGAAEAIQQQATPAVAQHAAAVEHATAVAGPFDAMLDAIAKKAKDDVAASFEAAAK